MRRPYPVPGKHRHPGEGHRGSDDHLDGPGPGALPGQQRGLVHLPGRGPRGGRAGPLRGLRHPRRPPGGHRDGGEPEIPGGGPGQDRGRTLHPGRTAERAALPLPLQRPGGAGGGGKARVGCAGDRAGEEPPEPAGDGGHLQSAEHGGDLQPDGRAGAHRVRRGERRPVRAVPAHPHPAGRRGCRGGGPGVPGGQRPPADHDRGVPGQSGSDLGQRGAAAGQHHRRDRAVLD